MGAAALDGSGGGFADDSGSNIAEGAIVDGFGAEIGGIGAKLRTEVPPR